MEGVEWRVSTVLLNRLSSLWNRSGMSILFNFFFQYSCYINTSRKGWPTIDIIGTAGSAFYKSAFVGP